MLKFQGVELISTICEIIKCLNYFYFVNTKYYFSHLLGIRLLFFNCDGSAVIPWRFLQEGSPTTGPQPPALPATEELMVARQGTPRPPPVRRSKSRRLQLPPPPLPPPPPADNTTTDPEVRLRRPLLAEPLPIDEGPARLRRRSRRRLPRGILQGISQGGHPSSRIFLSFYQPNFSSFARISTCFFFPFRE